MVQAPDPDAQEDVSEQVVENHVVQAVDPEVMAEAPNHEQEQPWALGRGAGRGVGQDGRGRGRGRGRITLNELVQFFAEHNLIDNRTERLPAFFGFMAPERQPRRDDDPELP